MQGPLFSFIFSAVKSVYCMSITVNESTDGTDTVQLSVLVRYFNRETFKEELLCFLPLKTNTAGETMYTTVKGFFEKNSPELGN